MKLLDMPLHCLWRFVDLVMGDKEPLPEDIGLTKKTLVFIGFILIVIQIICVAVRLLCPS